MHIMPSSTKDSKKEGTLGCAGQPVTSHLNLITTPGDEQYCVCFTDDPRQRPRSKTNRCHVINRDSKPALSDIKHILFSTLVGDV